MAFEKEKINSFLYFLYRLRYKCSIEKKIVNGKSSLQQRDAPDFNLVWRGWGLKGGCAVDNVKN